MSPALDLNSLASAFADRSDISEGVKKVASTPQLVNLFNEISSYVCELQSGSSLEHVAKKRRIDGGSEINNSSGGAYQNGSANGAANGRSAEEDNEDALISVSDISVVIPQRKKYAIEITNSRIRARDPKTKEIVAGVGCRWADIEHAFLLPVPEKAQKQLNYVLLPSKSFLPVSKAAPQTDIPEPLIFTIPCTAPKAGTISGTQLAIANSVADDYKSLFDWALNRQLQSCKGSKKVQIIEANEKQFHSVLKQSHRPNEKAVHVAAFRGSKDGFLFFLETGILWAFKKPVLFLPIDRIASVAYTSVLQRTFNLSVEVFVDGEEKEETEFTMLNQEDFAGIDAYIKRYGLQDGSMAVARKAKREGANVVKNEAGEVVGTEEGGHLARAAKEGGVGGDDMEGVQGGWMLMLDSVKWRRIVRTKKIMIREVRVRARGREVVVRRMRMRMEMAEVRVMMMMKMTVKVVVMIGWRWSED